MTPPADELPLEIDVHAVKALTDAGEEFLLLDCREQDEYQLVRIEGSHHLPMSETPDRVAELEPYRAGRIVVHCHLGGRSLQVAQWLRSQGFQQAQNMTGGIEAWSVQIDPSLPRY